MNALPIIVALLGAWNVYGLTELLSLPFPLYISAIFICFLAFFLYRKYSHLYKQISLGNYVTAILSGTQLIVAILYAWIEPSIAYLGLFLLFIGIEMIRVNMGRRFLRLKNQQKQMEEERMQVNETFRVVRSQRHDFLKHVSALQFMIERDEVATAKEYINELVDVFEETNLSIKGEKGVVAGILHQMYRRAKENQVQIVYHLDVPLSSLPIKDQELVSLIGNVLTNAIEAAESWQEEKGEIAQITLHFYKRSGMYLLSCSNSSLPIPNPILDALFEKYGQTTKLGPHEGMGTKIIADIVKKHQGYLDFTYKSEEFSLKIKVPAIM
ncbi:MULTISPECIES: sensor histidine kinase [unclassified Peribacillus]|uniref:sensor histidine kinase n=1 Tax=unclassified Peribacillus TaxID=2675266 RepID=UPI0019143524|nr:MULTISPECIES: GHKL domain-containing protein [unclassified Peribacillus]MBK5444718.1 GHKL domain-containing protein [Peribacillus sp. TH24]MBK5460577.1 GHKL domain-containing protein [Peribacillus sp. TH27]MBK5498732.1 GHKL domain-containing protein [Peribacillus sp. TH14]